MKLLAVLFDILALAVFVNAQYFSEGWAPGRPTTQEAPPQAAPTFVVQRETTTKHAPPAAGLAGLLDITNILSSEPAAYFFSRLGINITERLESAAQQAKIWDERVPLITDDNYKDLIVNEPLTEQEENDRTWIIIITVTANKQDGISKYMDDIFDAAFNETQLAGDLPNVRWGRIDYFNVTAITTKWAIWQAPYLVVLRDRGQTLRFYRPHQLRLRDGAMRVFLENEDWKTTPVWSTIYAPGGEREYVMDFLAIWMTRIYNIVVIVPRWLLFVISGSVASVVINLLHRGSSNRATSQKQERPKISTSSITPTTTTSSTEQNASGVASPSQSNKKRRTKLKK